MRWSWDAHHLTTNQFKWSFNSYVASNPALFHPIFLCQFLNQLWNECAGFLSKVSVGWCHKWCEAPMFHFDHPLVVAPLLLGLLLPEYGIKGLLQVQVSFGELVEYPYVKECLFSCQNRLATIFSRESFFVSLATVVVRFGLCMWRHWIALQIDPLHHCVF